MTKQEIQKLLDEANKALQNANPSGILYPAIVNKVTELEKALENAE